MKRRTALLIAGFVLFVFVLCPIEMTAQGLFGTIGGTVTDPSGGVIPGATVKVINVNTNVAAILITNGAGVYSAPNLNPGIYTLEAEAPGFKTAVAKNIALEVNTHQKIDLTLEVGQTSEVIEVISEAPLLQTQQSSAGQTVNQRQLEDLPVQSGSGRSFYSLVALAAGVTQQVGQGYDLDNMRINGGRPRMDDYLLDGTSVQQPVWGGPAVTPSIDSIQELRVETNSFSAEYGKVSGGVISAVTRAGTNQFHGSVYEFIKNDALNARNFFESSGSRKLPLRYNEFGATFGGPISKNKLFFFTDYQGIRASTSSPSLNNLVPSAAFRAGDLSALGLQLQDPQGNPFPDNQVPVGSIAAKVLQMFPAGNGGPSGQPGVDYYNGPSSKTTTINRLNPRIDWNLGKSDRVFGVYHYQREREDNKNALGLALAGSFYQRNYADTISAGWTHTFTSTLLNEFRFGFDHRRPMRTTNGYGISSPVDFGISGLPECNLTDSNGKCGAPTIAIAGYTGVGGGSQMLIEPAGSIQFTNTLTKAVGRHNLKLGGEIRRVRIDNIQPNVITGNFTFNGQGTGNPFADFLLGYLAKSSVQIQSEYLKSRAWADALFIQDDWKLAPRLTLNLGLRWQYDPSFRELNHQTVSFNPYTLQWERFGIDGVPEGAMDTHWKEFGPRLGFAWNPRGGLVLRGGYGITFPGYLGHGRAGDAQPSPNILAATQINPGTYLTSLPAINLPNPDAPLTIAQAQYQYYIPRKQAPTYVQQWNLTLEQQVARDAVVQIAYTGSHGVHLPVQYNYNICQQSRENVAKYGSAAGNMDSPYCGPGNISALGGFYGDYIYPGWWGISSSIYHALQAKIEKRYSRGFYLLSTFTWSKLIDDSSSDWSGFGSLDAPGTDFYDRRSERSVSAGDIPLRWALSPVYELPLGQGKPWLNNGPASRILGGWRVAAIYTLSSGEPLGISDYGYNYGNAARMITVRPTMIGDPLPPGFQQTLDRWFNTDAFDWSGTKVFSSNLIQTHGSANPAYAFGNAPRFFTNLRGPKYSNLDLSLQKDLALPLGERSRLRFQLDAFNLLNHPQFANPDVNSDANFGKITSTRTAGGRMLQFGLRFAF